MPIKPCQYKGQKGYKWGDSGKCYTGPNAKEKALKQGRAIEIRKHMNGEQADFSIFSPEQLLKIGLKLSLKEKRSEHENKSL